MVETEWTNNIKEQISKSPSEKAERELYKWLKDRLGYYL